MSRLRRAGLAAALVSLAGLAACGPAPGDPRRQIGPNPELPPIHQYLLPPMRVPAIVGWGGRTPTVADLAELDPAIVALQSNPPGRARQAGMLFCQFGMRIETVIDDPHAIHRNHDV